MLVFYPPRRTDFRPILKTPTNPANRAAVISSTNPLKCLALLKNPTKPRKPPAGNRGPGTLRNPFP